MRAEGGTTALECLRDARRAPLRMERRSRFARLGERAEEREARYTGPSRGEGSERDPRRGVPPVYRRLLRICVSHGQRPDRAFKTVEAFVILPWLVPSPCPPATSSAATYPFRTASLTASLLRPRVIIPGLRWPR